MALNIFISASGFFKWVFSIFHIKTIHLLSVFFVLVHVQVYHDTTLDLNLKLLYYI